MSRRDPTRGETPDDPLAAVILATIEAEPHHRRLYPDLYVDEVAAAVRRHQAEHPESITTTTPGGDRMSTPNTDVDPEHDAERSVTGPISAPLAEVLDLLSREIEVDDASLWDPKVWARVEAMKRARRIVLSCFDVMETPGAEVTPAHRALWAMGRWHEHDGAAMSDATVTGQWGAQSADGTVTTWPTRTQAETAAAASSGVLRYRVTIVSDWRDAP